MLLGPQLDDSYRVVAKKPYNMDLRGDGGMGETPMLRLGFAAAGSIKLSYPIERYVIIYRIQDQDVLILRVDVMAMWNEASFGRN